MKSKIILIGSLIIVLLGALYIENALIKHAEAPTKENSLSKESPRPVSAAVFNCKDNKQISANFFLDTDTVTLNLSDGRAIELPSVTSGSGARYANSDESFVFWNKGQTAFIVEGQKQEMTYVDCAI